MRYSRFDATSGLYDVYDDGRGAPLNADLPVPQLGRIAGSIGSPASQSGRQLPAAARHVGKSWHPHGVIVTPAAGGALGAASDSVKAHPFLFAAAAGALIYVGFRVYVSEMQKWGERW